MQTEVVRLVDVNKLSAYSSILIGVIFLLSGVGMVYILITIGGVIDAVSALGSQMGTPMPSFSIYFTVGWIWALLHVVTGLVTLATGMAYLVQK